MWPGEGGSSLFGLQLQALYGQRLLQLQKQQQMSAHHHHHHHTHAFQGHAEPTNPTAKPYISPFAQLAFQAHPEGDGGPEDDEEEGGNEEGRRLRGPCEDRSGAALAEDCVAFRVMVTTREAGELPCWSRLPLHVGMHTVWGGGVCHGVLKVVGVL